MYKFSMVRDRIELNEKLKKHIVELLSKDAPSAYAGRKVLLAAREITVSGNYTFELPDCDLVIVADHFNNQSGTLKLTVTQVPALGQPGYPGRNCTLVCRQWTRSTGILLQGGIGGKGLTGDPGIPGKDGINTLTGKDGKDGGKGGTGKTGGTGGKGGKLTIMHVGNFRPFFNQLAMVPGGPGGAGGNGGPGGTGGEGVLWCKKPGPGNNNNDQDCIQGINGKQGPKGDVGKVGAKGADGTVAMIKLEDMNAFYNALGALGLSKKTWADYRFKAGEYYFRSFNADNPHHLQLALSELEAVSQLDPQNTLAATYSKQILNNQNILGLSRDVDIIPDFDRYETVYNNYYPVVDSIYKSAASMLLVKVEQDQIEKMLEREIANFNGLIDALTDDLKAAILGKEMADKEFAKAKKRVEEIAQKIQDKKEELENAEVDLFGAIIGTVALVASLVAAIPTMGTSLAGAATSLGFLVDTLDQAGSMVEIISQATNSDGKQTALDDLKKNAKGLKGYVEEVAKGVEMIISFPKMLEDAWAVKVDNEGYKQLIVQSVELAHQQLIAGLHQQQAQYALQAAEKRLKNANEGKLLAENHKATLTNDNKTLKKAALFLMKLGQHYTNTLSKYAFLAARSLEIYTLTDKSKDICFDYGYVHPDDEANYELGILPLANLVAAYITSWSRFGNLLAYREQYDNYFNAGNWVHDYHRLSITDSSILNDFKQQQQLNLTVSLNDLPPTRFETKADTVFIAFIGAKAQSGVITAVVEHSGIYAERTRDGKEISVTLNPRLGTATARTSPLQDEGVVFDPEPMDFRGRGVATNWFIHIEPSEMTQQKIDLSQVTEIQVWFGYQSFLVNTFANTPGEVFAITPQDNTLLMEQRSGKLYLVKKGVKLEIGNRTVLGKMGLGSTKEKVVTEEALDMLPYGGAL